MDPIIGYHSNAQREEPVLSVIPYSRHIKGIQNTVRKIFEVDLRERAKCESYHRTLLGLNVELLFPELDFFELAPPLYQAYFPLTLLWKFVKKQKLDPKVADAFEEEISSGFIPASELICFTRFIREDLMRWGIIMPVLFERSYYGHLSPKTSWAFDQVLQDDFFVTGSYLTFMARHIRDGVLTLPTGKGAEGLLDWLDALQKRTHTLHFEKILKLFPFTEHFDLCRIMLNREPSLENRVLALGCLRVIFRPYEAMDWIYLEKIGALWLDAPFDSFVEFLRELRENILHSSPLIEFNALLQNLFLSTLKQGNGQFFHLLQLQPSNKEDDEVRGLLRREVVKLVKSSDPAHVKNLFYKLIDYADFPYFWEYLPSYHFEVDDLHDLLVAVEKRWPLLTFSKEQQHHHQYYPCLHLNPKTTQAVRMAHFFPGFSLLPDVEAVDELLKGKEKFPLLSLLRMSRSTAHLKCLGAKQDPLLFLFEKELVTGNLADRWLHGLTGLNILALLPGSARFTELNRDCFEAGLQSALQELPKWNKTSYRLAYDFLIALSIVAEKHPKLMPKTPINLTLALESVFIYAVTLPLQQGILEAIARFPEGSVRIGPSPQIQAQLDAWGTLPGSVSIITVASVIFQRFNFKLPGIQILSYLNRRETGRI